MRRRINHPARRSRWQTIDRVSINYGTDSQRNIDGMKVFRREVLRVSMNSHPEKTNIHHIRAGQVLWRVHRFLFPTRSTITLDESYCYFC